MESIVSIIVPVYNCGSLLPKCVNSLLSQTYGHLEIILVDDGSTDDTPGICDKLGESDSRVKVLHKSNGGVSSARNAGIDAAQGEYITFADADDYVDPDHIESLLKLMRKFDSDVAVCSYITENEDKCSEPRSGSGAKKVADEINKIRDDPQAYSQKITDYIKYFDKKILRLPHESGIETQEGADAYKEAAEFLSTAPKLPPLTIDPKLTEVAKDMVKEMSKFKEIEEMDQVDRKVIIKKYGHYDGTLGESTDFGSVTPALTCVNLIVDDGNESRSNRKLMFREDYKIMGVACVPHDELGCITLIMYATDFAEGEGKEEGEGE